MTRLPPELPPLARGRVSDLDLWIPLSGITPARAGKSVSLSTWPRLDWNYPRSRGEECARVDRDAAHTGITPARAGKSVSLSTWPRLDWNYPRSRGEECARVDRDAAHTGITPARAGKRARVMELSALIRNYPRSRGEEIASSAPGLSCQELPPLARGRVSTATGAPWMTGITPARAGKRPPYL